jgi:hypothetical protein
MGSLDGAFDNLSADDVRAILRDVVARAGSQKATALEAGVSYAFLNDVLHGRREPSGLLLDALGLERVVRYRAKPETRRRKPSPVKGDGQ